MGEPINPTTTLPFVPPRIFRLTTDQPRAHCSVRQIMNRMLGSNLDQFRDPDGTLTSFTDYLRSDIIPEVSGRVVQEMGTPYDWCRRRFFQDGSGSDTVVLPNRAVVAVNMVFVRILPSLPWYRFSKFRNVDGTEFDRAGYVEPANTPAFAAPYALEANGNFVEYTGIEDADILVDTEGRSIIIPPRALLLTANAAVPFSSYSFVPGTMNIEVHFTFGYAPVSYESGAPLAFDPITGAVVDPNPAVVAPAPPDPVDYASGIPRALSNAVARLAANEMYRQNWRGISYGLSSINVDGASESYGSKPYSGDLDDDDKSILDKIVAQFGIQMGI